MAVRRREPLKAEGHDFQYVVTYREIEIALQLHAELCVNASCVCQNRPSEG
jgi:hypothetical protein